MRIIFFIVFFSICTLTFSQEKKDSIKAPVPSSWKVTGVFTFLFNQSSFTNWSSGGDNTIAGTFLINYDFNYKKGSWNWDNRLITSYGLSNVQGQGNRKTGDRFEYNSLLGKKSNNNWFFSFFMNFKTQYSRGFDYKKTPKVPISDFMAPGYLSFGPGMLWKKSDKMTVNIAPATSKFTFVSDEFSGKYGVEEGENTNVGLGFNLSGYFKFLLIENVTMENILSMYSDYLNKPGNVDIDYQMNYLINVNKYMNMRVALHMLIDDNASSKIQIKEIFGLGITYTFHKK